MKKIALSSMAVLLAISLANAQNPKEKRKILYENTELIYTVTEKNDKNGPVFIKDIKEDKTYLKGLHVNDKPSGKWYFYNEDGTLESHYNFDLNKLLYIDTTYLKKIDVAILDKNQDIIQNASIPTLLYPSHLFLKQIANDVIIPEEDYAGRANLNVKLKAVIQINGNAEYSVEYFVEGREVERKIILSNTDLNRIWIPANYKGKPIKSSFSINTSISNEVSKSNHRKFNWNY
jgi:hypothetical protein